MTQRLKIACRSYYEYSMKQHPDVEALAKAINEKKPIWFEFQDGARAGSIAKVAISEDADWGKYGFHLPKSLQVEIAEGKTVKVGVKSYHNNFVFLVDYDGTYVTKFQKGQAKAAPTETKLPDLLGNTIKVGDWVIYTPHGRYSSGKPSLGRLNRLSDAGSAWVMAPNRQGDEVEHRTDGAQSLIKVNMTPELHSTYMLCDSLQGLRTKLVIDLDDEAY